jgi:hypothetical protein
MSNFNEILEPIGSGAAEFFLAASLYYAHKVSFEAAADLAELSFDEFHYRLKEHLAKDYCLMWLKELQLVPLQLVVFCPFSHLCKI